ncbi:uncharacterized protein THITE_2132087 [Thermothielavioides terrestris NRRL 8126]|uniref:Uncharacterized protein n=1 Tax=Thermothielavioides terrestris (strain ATCC 38088 / NRRL 8126) TaxID=578455 RepID=G2RCN7_THETT|nr:uncharacterized protein THITE_2132087 [Thermothielavioides terrestris NRRL 8126]AEO70633.1 hypothetical protein THITE_2132087 [Thermothielavioides terrestris NRRL 8126]
MRQIPASGLGSSATQVLSLPECSRYDGHRRAARQLSPNGRPSQGPGGPPRRGVRSSRGCCRNGSLGSLRHRQTEASFGERLDVQIQGKEDFAPQPRYREPTVRGIFAEQPSNHTSHLPHERVRHKRPMVVGSEPGRRQEAAWRGKTAETNSGGYASAGFCPPSGANVVTLPTSTYQVPSWFVPRTLRPYESKHKRSPSSGQHLIQRAVSNFQVLTQGESVLWSIGGLNFWVKAALTSMPRRVSIKFSPDLKCHIAASRRWRFTAPPNLPPAIGPHSEGPQQLIPLSFTPVPSLGPDSWRGRRISIAKAALGPSEEAAPPRTGPSRRPQGGTLCQLSPWGFPFREKVTLSLSGGTGLGHRALSLENRRFPATPTTCPCVGLDGVMQ